jgi:hypothetical protein
MIHAPSRRALFQWLGPLVCACLAVPATSGAETRSFVVAQFYPANYFGQDTCPQGMNPTPDVFFKRDLKLLGVPQSRVKAMFDQDYAVQNGPTTTPWVSVVATRGNGRDNVYLHPTTVPDSNLKPAVGRYGYGFDLDGRGAVPGVSYEDPETHQTGIDNQLFRAIGCIPAYKGYPPPQAPLEAEYRWEYSRPSMGAWLITITGADLGKDGDVTVTMVDSLDAVTTQDANARIQRDMTYRVAAQPASNNVLRGRLRGGVIVTEPADISMQCDAYIQPRYNFRQARLRLTLKPDGSLSGVLGGYQPWSELYWSHAKVGYIDERGFGVDAPALYYALRRHADAFPDPKSGGNTAISAAYMIDAVPAFVNRSAGAADHARRPDPLESAGTTRLAPLALLRTLWARGDAAPPRPAGARRLRPDQYRRIIADVFGPGIQVAGRFEPDVREAGLLAIGAGSVGVTATGLEQYDAMARSIAAQVVDERHRGTLIPCRPQSTTAADDACAAQFFGAAGPLLYRRPLAAVELQQLVRLANAATRVQGNFYDGVATSLAGLLLSPQFLFREEVAEPDPDQPGAYRLTAYSKASQLSFFLWNSGPDRKLLAAAGSGRLHTKSGLASEVERMLRSPRLEGGMRAFFADMLQFDLFDTLAKDARIYPKWTTRVAQDAQEQTLRTIIDHLLTQRTDYRELFTTRRTFLTPLLGSLYRVPVPQDGAWQPYEFPARDPRAGIQAQASFVALHSHPGLSSPTLRGKALREVLLCAPVPPPPGNVDFTVAQDTHNPVYKTMRERLIAHRTNPTCAGCHKLMDPAGLALENFDSDAGYRERENGQLLDTRGELDGMQFSDAAGLGRALHDNPATSSCLVRRVYTYAVGRAAGRQELPLLRALDRSFANDGYRLPALLRRVATSSSLAPVAPPGKPATPLAARNTARTEPPP